MGESRGQDPVVVAHTLRADGFDASEDGTGRGTPLVLAHGQGNAELVRDGSPSLTCNHEAPIAFYPTNRQPEFGNYDDVSPAIKVGSGGQSGNPPAVAQVQWASGGGQSTEQGGDYAGTYEADASSILSVLRKKVGKEAVAEWGSRILDSLQSPEILRSWLHGERLRSASEEFRRWVDDRPLSCEKSVAGNVLREVWENGPDGRSSQGRGLAKQLAHQLGKALPQLPHKNAPEQRMSVRRLLPIECERLMGLPDSYTAITYRGRPAADGPRYKALGNSMAVPVVAWILRRLERVHKCG